MNILVTGGMGFIGSNFIHYWNKTHPNDIVTCFDKQTYASNVNNLDGATYNNIIGDICDYKFINSVIKHNDIIIHFAAESHVDNSINNADPFIETNIIGTYNILKACKEYNKRIHHISTDEVFGSLELNDGKYFKEETSYDPHSPYSASKASSDHLVRSFYHTYGLPITISNCSNNYGPRQHNEKLIPKIILNTLKQLPSPIYGDGRNVRDWIYVEDHCSAIDFILNNGKIGETYLIGGDNEKSNLDIIKSIVENIDSLKDWKTYVNYVNDRAGHDRRYSINCSKLKNLGWRAEYLFHNGIDKTIEWYKGDNKIEKENVNRKI